ncbi:MAG TPA: cation:proton antiporter, partial [Burkholderiaceae bacterium]
VLARVVADTRATGPVTDRAMVLSTLSALYALTLGSTQAELLTRPPVTLLDAIAPVTVVLGVSIMAGALLTLALRMALRFMSPTSENTSILLLALIAACTAMAAYLGGSAPLAALLGGMLLKQLHPRPWAWPRQLGTAGSLLTMLMFVLVSAVAAQADWNAPVAGTVLALIAARLLAQAVGVGLGNIGSGASWRQALWVGCAMSPMSSIALLVASQFVAAAPALGPQITRVALPTILLMEILGAVLATVAIYRAGESARPWGPVRPGTNGTDSAGDNHGS